MRKFDQDINLILKLLLASEIRPNNCKSVELELYANKHIYRCIFYS